MLGGDGDDEKELTATTGIMAKAAKLFYRDEKDSMSEAKRTAQKMIATMNYVINGSIKIDTLAKDGGTRARPLDASKRAVEKILEKGWEGNVSSPIVVFEDFWDKDSWLEFVTNWKNDAKFVKKWKKENPFYNESEHGQPPVDHPQPFFEMFPDFTTRGIDEIPPNITGNDPDMLMIWRVFFAIDGNHRVWANLNLITGKWEFKVMSCVIPTYFHGVRLLFHDKDNIGCTALTAMYCNEIGQASSPDNYYDRLVATRGLVKSYMEENNTSKVEYKQVAEWLGYRVTLCVCVCVCF